MREVIATSAVIACLTSALAADRVVRVSEFGWNADDAAEALQRSFDSDARTVIVDHQAGEWISRPLKVTRGDKEIVFEDGVVLRAKAGEFHQRVDSLLNVERRVQNVVLRGEGVATLVMLKRDYQDPVRRRCG